VTRQHRSLQPSATIRAGKPPPSGLQTAPLQGSSRRRTARRVHTDPMTTAHLSGTSEYQKCRIQRDPVSTMPSAVRYPSSTHVAGSRAVTSVLTELCELLATMPALACLGHDRARGRAHLERIGQ
jgi:hypothetical protein